MVQHDLVYIGPPFFHRSFIFGLIGALGSMPICGYGVHNCTYVGFEFKIECSSSLTQHWDEMG